jgi:aminopeptidase N
LFVTLAMPVNYRKYGALGGLLLAAACQRATYPTAAITPAARPAPPVVPGVARELAEFRKQILSRVAYDLRLTVPASKADPVRAEQTVSFRLRDNRTPVQLDFKGQPSQLHTLLINGQVAAIDYRQEHLVLPAAALRVGDNVVKISLDAGDLSLNRNADYLYTLLVPDRARTVVPVFDQPNLKATFALGLTVPAAWQAVANGPLRETSGPLADGAKPGVRSYAFAPSDSISTYLFSFAAGQFTRVTQQVQGRPMHFLHRETDSAKIRLSMPAIFRLHGEALAFLEKYTGIPYPFQKFDFTAIPDFQYGGMEHVGNIDYKAASLFLDEGATKDQLLARQNLIGHETAHMWFGDLVTMQWFNDVWMKEVFANFMADKMNPEASAGPAQLLKFVTDHYPAAYAVDRTAGANPIRQPLENLQDAGSLYGNIIYHKAPIMMRQLELLMGEKPFQEGIQEYLKKYAHGNATWPDLIAILDAHTPADLAAWNQVWVNQPGRPVFDYHLLERGGTNTLIISQKAENWSFSLWPQQFEVLLAYADGRHERRRVSIDSTQVRLALPAGQQPSYVLLNANGLGYGVFPVDPAALNHLASLTDPVARASIYIALYENMLAGRGLAPRPLLDRYLTQTAHETNDLNIKLLTGQLSAIFWQFLKPAERIALAPTLEKALWQAMLAQPKPGEQKLYFKAYQSIALTPAAQKRLYQIWQTQKAPALVKLTEDDYTALALALAVRDYAAPQPLLPQQLARITNTDRRQRLEFLMPALSPDVATRDQFFASLKDEKNREKEAWVQSALGYLHHPLRQATSEKYLPASLDLLEEIQQTGDIFFPAGWLQATLGSYQSPAAARTVRAFLAAHPNYNPQLRNKLLQAADDLFRAEKLAM